MWYVIRVINIRVLKVCYATSSFTKSCIAIASLSMFFLEKTALSVVTRPLVPLVFASVMLNSIFMHVIWGEKFWDTSENMHIYVRVNKHVCIYIWLCVLYYMYVLHICAVLEIRPICHARDLQKMLLPCPPVSLVARGTCENLTSLITPKAIIGAACCANNRLVVSDFLTSKLTPHQQPVYSQLSLWNPQRQGLVNAFCDSRPVNIWQDLLTPKFTCLSELLILFLIFNTAYVPSNL